MIFRIWYLSTYQDIYPEFSFAGHSLGHIVGKKALSAMKPRRLKHDHRHHTAIISLSIHKLQARRRWQDVFTSTSHWQQDLGHFPTSNVTFMEVWLPWSVKIYLLHLSKSKHWTQTRNYKLISIYLNGAVSKWSCPAHSWKQDVCRPV